MLPPNHPDQDLFYLAMSEQLIPLFPSKLSLPIVLRSEGVLPHQAIRGILNAGRHHVVRIAVSELFQCGS
jgi:hypothetical protein